MDLSVSCFGSGIHSTFFAKYRSAAYTATKHLEMWLKSQYRKVLKKTMKLWQKNIANKTCPRNLVYWAVMDYTAHNEGKQLIY